MRLLVDELVHGNRHIVTNLAIRFDGLTEHLSKNYPTWYAKQSQHLRDRITVLAEEDLSRFFTFRSKNIRIASIGNAEWKLGTKPDYSQAGEGVAYFLDEIHIAFNARAWADTGQEVIYYLSQHAKLGDTVVCITQHIGNVDKQFRSVAQDFTYIRNLSKERMGMFKLPAVFIRNTFLQPANDTTRPMETGTFSLDVSGIASCYDTAQGVGIHGRHGADKTERRKGLHWLWFVVGIPLICALVWKYVPPAVASVFSPKTHRVPQKPAATNEPAAVVPVVTNVSKLPTEPAQVKSVLVETNIAGYVVGRVPQFIAGKQTGRIKVQLSDGREFLDIELNRLSEMSRRGFRLDSDGYYLWHPPKESKFSQKQSLSPVPYF